MVERDWHLECFKLVRSYLKKRDIIKWLDGKEWIVILRKCKVAKTYSKDTYALKTRTVFKYTSQIDSNLHHKHSVLLYNIVQQNATAALNTNDDPNITCVLEHPRALRSQFTYNMFSKFYTQCIRIRNMKVITSKITVSHFVICIEKYCPWTLNCD